MRWTRAKPAEQLFRKNRKASACVQCARVCARVCMSALVGVRRGGAGVHISKTSLLCWVHTLTEWYQEHGWNMGCCESHVYRWYRSSLATTTNNNNLIERHALYHSVPAQPTQTHPHMRRLPTFSQIARRKLCSCFSPDRERWLSYGGSLVFSGEGGSGAHMWHTGTYVRMTKINSVPGVTAKPHGDGVFRLQQLNEAFFLDETTCILYLS